MTLCAVDTGVEYHAEAWFSSAGALCCARLVRDVEPVAAGGRLVIEVATPRPRDGRTKLRAVLDLNRAAGRLGALHPNPEYRLPEEWKGQLPKRIDHERTMATLTDTEKALLPTKKADLGHVLDAVGIGLKSLGRR